MFKTGLNLGHFVLRFVSQIGFHVSDFHFLLFNAFA